MLIPALAVSVQETQSPLFVLNDVSVPMVRTRTPPPWDTLVLLLDQLTDSQLAQVGSLRGLSVGALTTPEQRALFTALVPEGMALRVTPRHQAVLADSIGGAWPLETYKSAPALSPPQTDAPPQVPRQRKPGQLDFANRVWDANIALDGVATVAALLARCQEATGRGLRADLLFRGRQLQTKTSPGVRVRVGDVLKALCRELPATFRQVGPVSLLVYDVEGVGVLSVRSYQALDQQYQAALRARERLATRPLGSLLGVAPSLAGRYPINQIPTPFQAPVQTWLEKQRRLRDEAEIQRNQAAAFGGRVPPPPPPKGRVSPAGYPSVLVVTTTLDAEAVVPGKGVAGLLTSVSLPLSRPPETPAMPVVLERHLGQGTRVLAAPKTAEEARALVLAAAQQGIGIVWIQVDQDLAPLDAALRLGKEKRVAIGAALSLLRPNDPTVPAAAHDQTLLGEVSPWLLPSAPETRASLQRRLTPLKKRTGLSGVLCLDTAPPGYTKGDFSYDNDGTGLGYTLPQRLAFLREQGRDPLDLGEILVQGALARELQWGVLLWNRQRREARAAFLREAFDLLHTDFGGGRPVFFWGDSGSWIGSWDSADRLPEYTIPPFIADSIGARAPFVHILSQQALYALVYQPTQPLSHTVRTALAGDLTSWDGLMLDLRQVPSGKIGEILTGITVKN